MDIENRKGARKIEEVPPHIKKLLSKGKIPSKNLVETLSIDYEEFLKNVLKDLNRKQYLDNSLIAYNALKKQTMPQAIKSTARVLLDESIKNNDNDLIENIKSHPSDITRSWGPYIIGYDERLSIEEKLNLIKDFAIDEHHSVREEAWIGLRESIIENLDLAIDILSDWSKDSNEYIRRYASEATRPRGVWCKHSIELKDNPQKAIAILEPLKSDNSKYVQDSVGNWLNDASKSQKDWVIKTTNEWIDLSPTKQTQKIVKRALRTINK
ncbi:DNA alkylation repair protein [Methanobrevibacter sp. DSM 116169]|uniref:DNA alkylation repair protein n=1 Tax=Methanobrevibacter sp. DSM 116169 TaxID=3242727 RepID=UPI0038FC904C